MSKLRIGLDIDGVYADFVQGFTREAERLGVMAQEYDSSDQREWDFGSQILPGRKLAEVWDYVDHSWNWWMTLAPLATARDIDLTNGLIEEATVFFITSRQSSLGLSVEEQSSAWLRGIGVNADKATVISAQGAAMKGGLASALQLDSFLDDNTGNLVAIRNTGCEAVARTWEYNKDWDGPRANTIRDFILMRSGRLVRNI